ncbi:hypothetical protein ILUMI_07891 [Ignelater luminosus]|uniref:Uncharacterized protein n=1 Tax=Ignelater luminosus TaxID=2038154 RepID=A0A8K0D302_IGNLU|nr:hypothetical protein ILUMI_07891 [Ignelater luminosus]
METRPKKREQEEEENTSDRMNENLQQNVIKRRQKETGKLQRHQPTLLYHETAYKGDPRHHKHAPQHIRKTTGLPKEPPTHAMFILRKLMEILKTTYLCFVDLTRPCDKIKLKDALRIMKNQRIPYELQT